ncbi:MAG: hypothetical protein IKK77_02705 [Clostridia bacterium]|nr:hypothetical protein [Clostridia bacterium]
MKSDIKIMLLGIAVMLLSIYTTLIFQIIGFILLVVGIVVVLYGFFCEKHSKDLTEETYNLLLKREIREEKNLVCKKCGETYKEGYTSCPWCGYKEE